MAQDESQTPSENFKFNYDSAYGQNGLSQPYAGPFSTGQSDGTGVAINASDSSQKVYTLVETNPDIGVGGPRGPSRQAAARYRQLRPRLPGVVLHRAPHRRRRDRHHIRR